jgi:signal transduction histidine kinase
LRNPLNTIGSSTYYLKRVLNSENAKVQEHLDIINQEIRRSQSIITNLLDFARKSPVDRSSVNINKILYQTLALVKKELSNKSIELVKEFADVKPCYVNSDDMKQVFLNLILNSNNAMPNGGILTVKTRMNDNKSVVVEFTDSGHGIEAKYLNKIFDPFFTTNKDGNGVGIGLSIVHSAIDRNKGNISVTSQVGKGTTFQLELPVYVEDN